MTPTPIETTAALKEHNRVVWGRMAPTYSGTFETLTREAADALLDGAGVGIGTNVLDVGTGPGTLIGPAKSRGATVAAVDLSEAMVDEARRRHPETDVRVGDVHDLPFDDAMFDAATLAFCLHHIPQPELALTEVRRVLRPGGRVAFAVWAPASRLELFGLVFEILSRHADLSDAPALQAPAIGDRLADYEALLDSAGFAQPAARVIEICWALTDGGDVFDAFDGYFDLSRQSMVARRLIRDALDEEVRRRADGFGRAQVPNPAVVASARRP
jgi:SAM-dependent methyltransferase